MLKEDIHILHIFHRLFNDAVAVAEVRASNETSAREMDRRGK
jgi:hypothetical protein